MGQAEWKENTATGEHECGAARAINESDAFCILTFGTDDPATCLDAIIAGTRYENAKGPITVARVDPNRAIINGLQEQGVIRLGPYVSDDREMVAIVAINSDHLGT